MILLVRVESFLSYLQIVACSTTPNEMGRAVFSISFAFAVVLLITMCIFFLDNKLQQRGHINLQNKKKKSQYKKITGFQVNEWLYNQDISAIAILT